MASLVQGARLGKTLTQQSVRQRMKGSRLRQGAQGTGGGEVGESERISCGGQCVIRRAYHEWHRHKSCPAAAVTSVFWQQEENKGPWGLRRLQGHLGVYVLLPSSSWPDWSRLHLTAWSPARGILPEGYEFHVCLMGTPEEEESLGRFWGHPQHCWSQGLSGPDKGEGSTGLKVCG